MSKMKEIPIEPNTKEDKTREKIEVETVVREEVSRQITDCPSDLSKELDVNKWQLAHIIH